ncbi:MAG: phage head-tail connector protein [Planctomycetota bacterium]
MSIRLAQLADVKAALNFSGTDEDAVLARCIEQASAVAERLVGRSLGRVEQAIEYPRAIDYGVARLWLKGSPIESVAMIKLLGWTGNADEFSTIDPLGEDLYEVDGEAGLIELLHGEAWSPMPRANLVVYTHGYANADATPGSDGLAATAILPGDDLQQGVVVEAIRLYRTQGDAGLDQVKAGKAGAYRPDHDTPHPALAQACEALRRVGV